MSLHANEPVEAAGASAQAPTSGGEGVVATAVPGAGEPEAGQTHAQLLAHLLEQASEGYCVLDAEGRFTFVNAGAERLWRHGRAELLGRSIWEVFPEAVRSGMYPAFQRVVSQQTPETFEEYSAALDLWLEFRAYPSAEGLIVSFRDVTDRKRLEQALQERGSQTDAIFDALTDGVVVIDATGQVILMNEAYRRLIGYSASPPADLVSQEERSRRFALRDPQGQPLPPEQWPLQRILRGESLTGDRSVDILLHTLDERDLLVNVSGAPVRDTRGRIIGVAMVTRDVTEQRRLERELDARAREIESIFDTMADGVALYDREGHVVRANQAYYALLGIGPREEFFALPPERRAALTAMRDSQNQPLPDAQLPIPRALHGETLHAATAMDVRTLAFDGRERDLNVSAAPLYDAGGAIAGAVAVWRDVTERRRLEQQRTRTLRVVAHELANPVAGVKLYVQAEQRRLQPGRAPIPPSPQLLELTTHAVERIERLLRDLNAAVSIEAGTLRLQLTRCDLVTLCQREVELQRAVTGREIQLTLPEQPVEVVADAVRVGQVLANLVSNALKYSPPERPVTVALAPHEGQAWVSVRDEGPGIPASDIELIWQPFHRLASVREQEGWVGSLGLGLAISRAIIQQHGGHIGVESRVGLGSTFWFSLSLAPAQPAASEPG
jgi:PAS domain S-box-containing protein